MNNYKSVRNRLFKNSEVELKSEKVELGLVDDFNSRVDKADNARKKSASSLANFEGDIAEVVINLRLALKEALVIDKAAKELGVNSPVDVKKIEARLKKWLKVESTVNGLSI